VAAITDDYDSPWKEAIENFLPDCLAFFFPAAFEAIDWTREPAFLDKELQQIRPEAEHGRRIVDKLVQVFRHDGTDAWVLIHIEIQSESEADFAERMYTYHYRLFDRFKRPIVSLAILGDEHPNWRPSEYTSDLWGYGVRLTFRSVKLLDYRQALSELEASTNPFAIIVLAHLTAQETRRDPDARLRAKLAVVRRLYSLGYNRVRILRLFRFVDWVLRLPEDLEDRFWNDWRAYELEQQMRYITSVERIGRREGRKEGLSEGRKEGLSEGLRDGLELALKLKFGAASDQIIPEVRRLTDVAQIRFLYAQLESATTIDEVRQALERGS
jgi:hypothetical protein